MAVLLALLGCAVVLDARERERLEYLADVPGVLSPLHDPPGALRPWAPSAGALVAEDSAGRWTIGARYHLGGVDLRGTDPDTGDVLWSVPFSLDAAPAAGRPLGVPVGLGALHHDDLRRRPPGRLRGRGLPGACRRRRHPSPGARPRDRPDLATCRWQPGSLWSVTGSHLVVASPQRDDAGGVRWVLTATDPATGDVQWLRRTPLVPEVHAVRLGDRVVRSQADLTADDDRVLLADSGHAWLFGADGQDRGDVTVETAGWAELGRSGTLVWTSWQPLAVPAGILVTRDGTRTAVAERPARLAVDDGSAPDVVLLSDGEGAGEATLVGRDATSGEELWRLTGTRARSCSSTVSCTSPRAARSARSTPGRASPAGVATSERPRVPGHRRLARRRRHRRPDAARASTGPTGGSPSVADVARHLARDPGGVDQVERVRRAAARAVPRRVRDRRRLAVTFVTPGCGRSTPVWHDDRGPPEDPSFRRPVSSRTLLTLFTTDRPARTCR